MNNKTITNSPIGSSWEDVRNEIFTPEEIAESNLRASLILELIEAKKEKGISHTQTIENL